MRFDRQLIAHFEWPLLALAVAICGLGLLSVYSATYQPDTPAVNPLVVRQAAWFAAGLVGMLAALTFDYRTIERYAYPLYALTVVSLLLVPLLGVAGGGSRRWLRLGPVSVQPSEIMKLMLVVALARYFPRVAAPRGFVLRQLVVPLALFGVPGVAILLQPDLGTFAILGIVFVSVALVAGARPLPFVGFGLAGLAVFPFVWGHLKAYQQQRILTFFNPESDPLGAGYHVIQSKIAVGSGGLWGKGFLRGTQNQLNFLPEEHTDFIFSVFAEEWGFVGAALLLTLYAALLLRGLVIASRARDGFGALVAAGVTAILFWQVVVNVGMTTGLLPVVGIPLPLLSYGGSSLATLLTGIGLMMNVQMRRFTFTRGT
jgi:rod shape determining protein RodA